MSTKSVRVDESTHSMLTDLKEKTKSSSMDELLRKLAKSYGISMFGADPELPAWDEESDRADFRE